MIIEALKYSGLAVMLVGCAFLLATMLTYVLLLFQVRWEKESPTMISRTFLMVFDDEYLTESGVRLRDRIPKYLLYAFRFGIYGFFLHVAIVLGILASGGRI
jgi:hypothetical protein